MPPLARSRSLAFVGLGIALVVGAFVRFWNLTGQSIFLDEAFTFDAAQRPLHDLLQQIAYHDAHPPLFYLVTHWLLMLPVFSNPLELRWITASVGLLTIAATWSIARTLFGSAAAAAAALIVATEPSLVVLDRLYRMYAPLAALTAISWWLLLVLQTNERVGARRLAGAAYAISAALLPSVQYLGGIVLASHVIFAAFGTSSKAVRWCVAAGCAAAAAALSWWAVWALPVQFRQGGYAGVTGMHQRLWEIPAGLLGYGLPVEWYHNASFAAAVGIVALAVVASSLAIARATIVPWYFMPVAIQALITAITGKGLLLSRYLIHLLPAFALSVAALVHALGASRVRIASFALAAAVIGIDCVALTNMLVDPVYQTPDWNLVGRIVTSRAQPGDAVVLDDGYPFLILRSLPVFAHRDIQAPTDSAQLPQALQWVDARPGRRIWYIENQYYYPDPGHRILSHLEATRRRLGQWLEPRADLSNVVYVALFGVRR